MCAPQVAPKQDSSVWLLPPVQVWVYFSIRHSLSKAYGSRSPPASGCKASIHSGFSSRWNKGPQVRYILYVYGPISLMDAQGRDSQVRCFRVGTPGGPCRLWNESFTHRSAPRRRRRAGVGRGRAFMGDVPHIKMFSGFRSRCTSVHRSGEAFL